MATAAAVAVRVGIGGDATCSGVLSATSDGSITGGGKALAGTNTWSQWSMTSSEPYHTTPVSNRSVRRRKIQTNDILSDSLFRRVIHEERGQDHGMIKKLRSSRLKPAFVCSVRTSWTVA